MSFVHNVHIFGADVTRPIFTFDDQDHACGGKALRYLAESFDWIEEVVKARFQDCDLESARDSSGQWITLEIKNPKPLRHLPL